MRIALINENSQAAKNSIIEASLRKVVEPMGFEVRNYGMYTAEDEEQLTYVQNGILAATLLNAGACDYVITGCGTGEAQCSPSTASPASSADTSRPLLTLTRLPRSTTETPLPFLSRSALAGAAT